MLVIRFHPQEHHQKYRWMVSCSPHFENRYRYVFRHFLKFIEFVFYIQLFLGFLPKLSLAIPICFQYSRRSYLELNFLILLEPSCEKRSTVVLGSNLVRVHSAVSFRHLVIFLLRDSTFLTIFPLGSYLSSL